MSAVPPESPRAAAVPSEHTTELSGQESQAGNPGTDFGPNEWLVDELYQRYLADPSSVAMEWWNFFADYRPPPGSPAPSAAAAGQAGPARASRPGDARARAGRAAGMPRRRVPRRERPPRRQPPPRHRPPRPPGRPSRAPDGKPAQQPAAPAPAPEAVVRLRGAAARTAENMAASLGVPTATSVRSIPAKLLADNRIVINNHLARGRGGKVSFTHLIGFAVVRALARCRR